MGSLFSGISRGIGGGCCAAGLSFILLLPQPLDRGVGFDALAALPVALVFLMPFALAIVSLATLTVGLALRWTLGRLGMASGEMLGLCGAVAGWSVIMLPALASGQDAGDFTLALALAGAIGGGVTGAIWGSVAERQCAKRATTAPPPPNRLHDERILR